MPHAFRSSAGGRATALVGILAVLSLSLPACGPKLAPAPLQPETLETYRVGTPDTLQITVLPEPAIERTATVRPDGRISMDLIGDVQASGRTVDEIAREIEERIARYKREPRVTVSVIAANSNQVTILGQVGNPSSITLTRQTRVIEAIGQLGGVDILGSKSSVRIIRFDGQQTQVIPVDVAAIERGDLRTNVMLQGGDLIVVPPNAWARVGFALNVIFFPIQQIVGLGSSAARTARFGPR